MALLWIIFASYLEVIALFFFFLYKSLTYHQVSFVFITCQPVWDKHVHVMSLTPWSCQSTPRRRMLTRCAVKLLCQSVLVRAKLSPFMPPPKKKQQQHTHSGICHFLLSLGCVWKDMIRNRQMGHLDTVCVQNYNNIAAPSLNFFSPPVLQICNNLLHASRHMPQVKYHL